MYGPSLQSADLHINSYIKQQRYRFVNSGECCKMFRNDAGILVLQFLEQNFSGVLFRFDSILCHKKTASFPHKPYYIQRTFYRL